MKDEQREEPLSTIEINNLVKEASSKLRTDQHYITIKDLCGDGGHSFSSENTVTLFENIQLCTGDSSFDIGTGVGQLAARLAYCSKGRVFANDLPTCLQLYTDLTNKPDDVQPRPDLQQHSAHPSSPSNSSLSDTSTSHDGVSNRKEERDVAGSHEMGKRSREKAAQSTPTKQNNSSKNSGESPPSKTKSHERHVIDDKERDVAATSGSHDTLKRPRETTAQSSPTKQNNSSIKSSGSPPYKTKPLDETSTNPNPKPNSYSNPNPHLFPADEKEDNDVEKHSP